MTWSETRRRLDALRAIEAELNHTGGELPWCHENAEIFGDRRTLLLQLRYRWRLLVEAQTEPFGTGVGDLAKQHPGLVAALRRYSWELTEITDEQYQTEQAGAVR